MSGWSAGFGNDLSPEELEVVERLYRASTHQTAKFHTPVDDAFDDLVQEGAIAGWKASQKASGDPVVYGAVSARRRIMDLDVKQVPMLGSETGGPSYDFARQPARRGDMEDAELLEGADLLSAIEDSYHHGEIMRALNALPLRHREYVYLRFWLGMANSEIAARRESTVVAEKMLWQKTIRPHLQRELAHLT